MDTKWKNKLIFCAVILLFTFGIKGLLSGYDQSTYYLKRNFFHTGSFNDYINQFIGYLNYYEFNRLTEDELKSKITVTAEEINEHRYRYGSLSDQIADIENQYKSRIEEARETGSTELEQALIAERDAKIADIKQNFTDDNHVRAKIIKEKEQEIDDFLAKLETYRPDFERMKSEFLYYFRDKITGQVYTNLNLSDDADVHQFINRQTTYTIRDYPSKAYGDIITNYFPYDLPYHPIVQELLINKDREITGQIAVPKTLPATSKLLADYQEFQQTRIKYFIYIGACLLAVILSILIYKKTAPQLHFSWERFDRFYHRWPFDVRVLSLICFLFLTYAALIDPSFFYHFTQDPPYLFWQGALGDVLLTAGFGLLAFLQLKYWWDRRQQFSQFKQEWRTSLMARTVNGFRDAFLNRRLATQVLIILTAAFAAGVGIIVGMIEEEFLLFYIPAFFFLGFPLLVYTFKSIGYLGRVMLATSQMVQGHFPADIEVKGKSAFADLARNINALKAKVKQSQHAQAKSERLKTELITNVSHDLRTPLTSIITYTELLKTPDLSEEDRNAYIEIIDRKAKRLKILIDDLFEASKMASGNIELVKDRVDLVQLLQQALAERDEAIKDSGLDFRVSTPDKPVYAYVDGQKLWRVFDNLLSNILKYALENTRVYITILTTGHQAIITFKNISKYELGENTDELLERFKRGDTSRHTEGSGLGLAIAKSIVDLHEGTMDLEVDGDLFKVVITLNLMA